jgi:amidase
MIVAGLLALMPTSAPAADAAADPVERSIDDLSAALKAGQTTSHALVAAYLARIARIDKTGPRLNSVIVTNPDALAQADALDRERKTGRLRGPLHGIPILIKDNIESADRMPTTAGSLALAANVSGRDAPLVARLRAAGAIIIGKTNLSEWANIRSNRSSSGWSGIGGLTRNPYALDRNTCGSSAGSGAAAAASLAAGAIGTETDGSVTCPASVNGLVGMKPTVGLVSRTYVVPISHSQDTAGPMTRSVRDAALLLTVLAGSDPADPATAQADAHKTDYAALLSTGALRGKRLGVMRFAIGSHPATVRLFEAALDELRQAGAILVDIDTFEARAQMRKDEHVVLMTELKADLGTYLAATPATVKARTLAEVIAFNKAHADTEMRWFGQETFEEAETTKGLADPDYLKARAEGQRLAGPDGIDKMLAAAHLDALIAPTMGPAWTTDLINGDHGAGGGAGAIPAIAGYPHLTVPMGTVDGLPVGLSFIGPAWSEARLFALGYSYEQLRPHRAPPDYRPSIGTTR